MEIEYFIKLLPILWLWCNPLTPILSFLFFERKRKINNKQSLYLFPLFKEKY